MVSRVDRRETESEREKKEDRLLAVIEACRDEKEGMTENRRQEAGASLGKYRDNLKTRNGAGAMRDAVIAQIQVRSS